MYKKGKEASELLGVSQQTLRKYADSGKIDSKRTLGNQRLYNVGKYLRQNEETDKVHVCYCRVSSYGQKDDLDHQIEYMKGKYPDYEIISDIGSGINFKRTGLKKLINYAIDGKLETLVVSYKDRLCRIGYDMLEYIFLEYSNTNIIVEKHKDETINEEISNDILQIITVYSAKIHGMRRYKKD